MGVQHRDGSCEGEPELARPTADKVRGDLFHDAARPGVIALGRTWHAVLEYHQEWLVERPEPPRLAIARIIVTDAAGRRWKITPARGARRIHRWQRRRLAGRAPGPLEGRMEASFGQQHHQQVMHQSGGCYPCG
jgi:hypothetical protein